MTQEIILTIGAVAAGKTSWATQYVKDNPQFVNLNRDDLRDMLYGGDYRFTRERERVVTNCQTEMARAAINIDKSVIVSDTNLNDRTTNHWEAFADEVCADLQYKHFYEDLDVLLDRNAQRAGGVPTKVVHDMYYKYVDKHLPEWKVKYDADLEDCILVDVDGTVAKNVGRSPYDWHRVAEDELHRDIIELVNLYARFYRVIVMTGRDGVAKAGTRKWLEDNGVHFTDLYTRAAGDMRKDAVVKHELFDEHIRGKYNVKFVVDDRAQVVYRWKAMGLRVLDVAGSMF